MKEKTDFIVNGVSGQEQVKTKTEVGKKTYLIPEESHPCKKFFEDGFKKSYFYHDLKDSDVKIGISFVYPSISKTVIARCIRTNNYLKLFSGYDYIIEFSGEVYDTISDELRKIVFHHECEHLFPKYDKEGNVSFRLCDHDVKDFKSVITEYGIEWFETLYKKSLELNKSKNKNFDENNFKIVI